MSDKTLLDKDIREPLFDFLEETYGRQRIIEEKGVGRSRADVVMVLPDQLVGIEIKSDADTYARLARQIRDYDQYFDSNIIVVGSSHGTHVPEHVPDYWGIISVEAKATEDESVGNKFDFYILREMQPNPHVDLLKKIRILWRPELAHIQEKNAMPAYKQKSKDFVREKIVEKISAEVLQEQISIELFERDYTKIAQEIDAYRIANGQRIKRHRSKRRYRKT